VDATPDLVDEAEPEGEAEPEAKAEQEAVAGSGQPSGRGVTMPVVVPVTVALVLGLAIGLIAGWLLPRPGTDSAAADQPVATDQAVTPDQLATDPAEGGDSPAAASTVLNPATPTGVDGGPDGTEEYAGLVVGTEGPLVELFEDYVCPFCARLELNSGAQLRERALAGEFRLVMHPIAFLTEDSPRAANASACVYQHEDAETWVAFHEGIYERQDPSEATGQFANEILLALADEVGATSEATSSCISGGSYNPWVAAITEQAFSRGVSGTPTLAVDGTKTDLAPLVQ
jgi:protein-disulfide isomerase